MGFYFERHRTLDQLQKWALGKSLILEVAYISMSRDEYTALFQLLENCVSTPQLISRYNGDVSSLSFRDYVFESVILRWERVLAVEVVTSWKFLTESNDKINS